MAKGTWRRGKAGETFSRPAFRKVCVLFNAIRSVFPGHFEFFLLLGLFSEIVSRKGGTKQASFDHKEKEGRRRGDDRAGPFSDLDFDVKTLVLKRGVSKPPPISWQRNALFCLD